MTTESTDIGGYSGFTSRRKRDGADKTAPASDTEPTWEERLAEARRKREQVMAERRLAGENPDERKPIVGPKPWEVDQDEVMRSRKKDRADAASAAKKATTDEEFSVALIPVQDGWEEVSVDETETPEPPKTAPSPAPQNAGMALTTAIERVARGTPQPKEPIVEEQPVVEEEAAKPVIVAPKREQERERHPLAAIGLVAAGTFVAFGLAAAVVMQLRDLPQPADQLAAADPAPVSQPATVPVAPAPVETPVTPGDASAEVVPPIDLAAATPVEPVTTHDLDVFFVSLEPGPALVESPATDSYDAPPALQTVAPDLAVASLAPASESSPAAPDLTSLAAAPQPLVRETPSHRLDIFLVSALPDSAPLESVSSAGYSAPGTFAPAPSLPEAVALPGTLAASADAPDLSALLGSAPVQVTTATRSPETVVQSSSPAAAPKGETDVARSSHPELQTASVAPDAVPLIPQEPASAAGIAAPATVATRPLLPSFGTAPEIAATLSARAPAVQPSLPGPAFQEPPQPVIALDVPSSGGADINLARFDIHLHAPSGLADDLVQRVRGTIQQTGMPVADPRRVNLKITSDQVRFFHPEDKSAAEALALAVNGRLRDFTSFSPAPPAGTIEVWMAGESAVRTRASRPAATTRQRRAQDPATALRNRIIQRLRRGDHL